LSIEYFAAKVAFQNLFIRGQANLPWRETLKVEILGIKKPPAIADGLSG
jgi:hypothetical protein